jgi:hypothetical protein
MPYADFAGKPRKRCGFRKQRDWAIIVLVLVVVLGASLHQAGRNRRWNSFRTASNLVRCRRAAKGFEDEDENENDRD